MVYVIVLRLRVRDGLFQNMLISILILSSIMELYFFDSFRVTSMWEMNFSFLKLYFLNKIRLYKTFLREVPPYAEKPYKWKCQYKTFKTCVATLDRILALNIICSFVGHVYNTVNTSLSE